jgi:hypothetical protein
VQRGSGSGKDWSAPPLQLALMGLIVRVWQHRPAGGRAGSRTRVGVMALAVSPSTLASCEQGLHR